MDHEFARAVAHEAVETYGWQALVWAIVCCVAANAAWAGIRFAAGTAWKKLKPPSRDAGWTPSK